MTRDLLEPPPRKPPAPGRLVVTGVVGACALGVTLGFWARPAAPGEPAPAAAPPSAPPRPALQIVVDEAPAPIGAPLEVLPADVAAAQPAPQPAPYVEPMIVPRRPVSGLVKVDAVVAAPPEVIPLVHETPKPKVVPPRKPKPVVAEAPRPDLRLAKAKAAEARVAQAKARKTAEKAAELAEARAQKAAELAQARTAKLEKAKAVKLAQAEKAKAETARAAKLARAEAERAKAVKLARADAAERGKAAKVARIEEAKAEARSRRLASLLQAVKIEARRLERAKATKVAVVKPAAKPVQKAPPKPAAKRPVRGEGPMRVARADVCASPDPGEAIVCADRRLGARDRQLQEAYRNAEAAGVPASALRNQQNRWLAARAAAAREAPWAVEDVYVARISELRDQTRDAREN